MILHELSSSAAERAPKDVVVLIALGAIEQHSTHLPLGTDALIVDDVARTVEARLSESVVLAPTLWIGASDHHLTMSGTASIGTDALVATATEIISSLSGSSGWTRFVLLNGHGGNQPAVRVIIEHARRSHPHVHVWGFDYWEAAFAHLDRNHVVRPSAMGHADHIETSILLARRPDLVDIAAATPDAYGDGLPPWVHSSLGIPERTAHGGVGDPTAASATFGSAFFDAAVASTVDTIRNLPTFDGS